MTKEEYFSDWLRVIDGDELDRVLTRLIVRGTCFINGTITPDRRDVFKAFHVCSLNSLNAVFLGQDPYPQRGVATGIAFGNRKDVEEKNISPSLRVLKEAVINLDVPHNLINFDNSLESWSKQGILMLNSALTVEVNHPGSHAMLWRGFTSSLLYNLSRQLNGIVYVLFGTQAQSFKPYIQASNNYILQERHMSYYARSGERMSDYVFKETGRIVEGLTGKGIRWYEESMI